MVNIYTEPIPNALQNRLDLKQHYYKRLVTIKNFLDYMLYTYTAKVYMKIEEHHRRGTTYAVYLKDLQDDDRNISDDYDKALCSSETDDKVAWQNGLLSALNWIGNNRATWLRATAYQSVGFGLLGEINVPVLDELKKALSLLPPNKKFILFHNVKLLPELAKGLITYCDYMFGLVPDPYNPAMVIIDDTDNESTPAPPVESGYNPYNGYDPSNLIRQDSWLVGPMDNSIHRAVMHDRTLDTVIIVSEPLYTIDDRDIYHYSVDPVLYMIIVRENRMRYLLTIEEIADRWGTEYGVVIVEQQYNRELISGDLYRRYLSDLRGTEETGEMEFEEEFGDAPQANAND